MENESILLDLGRNKVPYSVEAEQAVLGSILVDPNCISEVAVELLPEHFYLPQHKGIYTAFTSMFSLNQVIDFVQLLEKLKSDGIFDETGGKAYLSQLVSNVSSSANVLTYVAIVKDKFYARSLMNAAHDIIKDINDNASDSGKLIEAAEQKIYDIRQGRDVSGLTHVKTIIETETYVRLSKLSNPETRDEFIGIPSGIGELDRRITGLNKSDLIILGARPGMGKTSFALNIARNVAINAGKTVCFFSLEMTRDQLAQRLLSSEAGIKSEKMRTGDLDSDEWIRLSQAGETLSKAELYFDETSDITVPQIKAKIRRMKKVDLIVIDYLGLMHSAIKTESRVQEVSEITRSLKIMAKELKVPVLVCAQLSRGTEQKGKSHRPALADLRESGSIEQDADIVLFLYRDKYYDNEKGDGESESDPNLSECIIAKNRHGETDTIKLHFDGQFTRFTAVDTFRND